MVRPALCVALGDKFKESVRDPSPEPVIRGLEELVDPFALGDVVRVEPKRDRGRCMRLVGGEAEESCVAGSDPKLSLMIKQEVMKEIVRQALTLVITRRSAIVPAAIQPGRRGQPERSISVFDEDVDVMLLGIIVGHTNLRRSE